MNTCYISKFKLIRVFIIQNIYKIVLTWSMNMGCGASGAS